MKRVLLALLALATMQPALAMFMPLPNRSSHDDKKLLECFKQNHLEGVKKYIRKGANPELIVRVKKNNNWGDAGGSLLINAILDENTEMACTLINAGVKPDARYYHSDVLQIIYHPDEPALVLAAQRNLTDVCKLLLEHQADANAQTKDGKTALLWASENENQELIELLLLTYKAKVILPSKTNKYNCPSSCSVQ